MGKFRDRRERWSEVANEAARRSNGATISSMADELGPNAQQLAEHLRKLREDAGLTIEQLAQRAGLERDRVILIESGTVNQDLEEVSSYARGLGMRLSAVFRLWEQSMN
jgi:DNA-binding XRE family transcriptional regulator